MSTGFQFTAAQLSEIARLRAELSLGENASKPSGAVPLYTYIFKCVTGIDLTGSSFTTPINNVLATAINTVMPQDQHDAAVWLYGAIQVNSSSGAFSNVIREFNVRQGELRGKGTFSESQLQEASNKVGINLVDSILNPLNQEGLPNPTYQRLPTVQEIGASDLNGVRDVLYPGNETPGTELYLNQAWPGIVMLGALGGKYTDRLLRYDEGQSVAVDTLADFKAMLFCWDAFKTAWNKTCVGIGSISDVMIGLNFPASFISSVLAEYGSNGSAGLPGMVFNALVNLQQPDTNLSKSISAISTIGANKFLDMLIGAVQGKSLMGASTDANFSSKAATFFSAYGATLQTIGAKLTTNAGALASQAEADTAQGASARAALAALSVVSVDVSTVVATLNDWRDVLYAFKAYDAGFTAARAATLQQPLVDAPIMGNTLWGYLTSNNAQRDVINAIQYGADNSTLKAAFKLIGDVGQNKFLDMLRGTQEGKSLLGTTTDANFAANAKAFFGAMTPAKLQVLAASLMPTTTGAIESLAASDVNARAALMALSLVKVQVGTAVADTLGLYNEAANPGGLTSTWLHDRSEMLHAVAITRPGQNAVGATNTDYYDAGSNFTVVQRMNGVGANAPANEESFRCAA